IGGPDSSGKFTVTGDHKYVEGGTFTITITLKHDEAPDTTVTTTATVGSPAVGGKGGPVTAGENTAFTGKRVATFTDPAGAGPLTDYSAVINWGDGTATSAGKISGPDNTGVFTVTGDHKYVEEGTYTVTVTLKHTNAADTTVTTTATVGDPAV